MGEYWKPWTGTGNGNNYYPYPYYPPPTDTKIETLWTFICPNCQRVIQAREPYAFCPFCGANLTQSRDVELEELRKTVTQLRDMFAVYLEKKYQEKMLEKDKQ